MYWLTLRNILSEKHGKRADEINKLIAKRDARTATKLLAEKDAFARSVGASILGKIKDPQSFDSLLEALKDKDSYVRASAAEALGQLGDRRACGHLITAIEKEYGSLRVSGAIALKELGDERGIPYLQGAARSETGWLRLKAAEALQRFGDALGTETLIQLLTDKIEGGLALRPLKETYVDDCFKVDFGADERNWREMPEAKVIPEAGNSGRTDEAIAAAKQLLEAMPDLYFSYYWLGALYQKKNDFYNARFFLHKGLSTAKRKYDLYDGLGALEWKAGNLAAASRWWIKACVVRISQNWFDDPGSFLNLAHVAKALNESTAAARLMAIVDRIKQVGLTSEAAASLRRVKEANGRYLIAEAINRLNSEYLSKTDFISCELTPELTSWAKPAPLSVIIFREGFEPPIFPEEHYEHITREAYPDERREVIAWRTAGVGQRVSVSKAGELYRRNKSMGALPDWGEPVRTWEGMDTESQWVVALFFE